MANANRYNFASTGNAGVEEMTRILAEREARQRQAMLDQITQREMALREQTEARQADYQTKAFEDAALNRESVRADRVYEDLMPRDVVDPATAALLRKHGRGGGLRDSGEGVVTPEQMRALDQQRVAQVAASPTGEADLSGVGITPAVAPGVIYSERGGPKYAAARVAADERAALLASANQSREATAAANRTASEEKAAADREFKLLMAQMQNSTNTGQRALANELTQLRIDNERSKQGEAATADTRKRETAVRMADDMTGLIDEILDTSNPEAPKLKPGMGNVVGARIPFSSSVPGSDAANASAALERLKGQMVVELMSEMKAQSRTGATGFGALSERELSLIQAAAAKLNPNQGEANFARELKRIRDKVQLVHQDGSTSQAAGGAGAPPSGAPRKMIRDASGKLVFAP